MLSLKSAGCVFLDESQCLFQYSITTEALLCYSVYNENFGAFKLQKLATYCYLNPTDLIHMLSLLPKEYSKFQVTELEHERQNESNVLIVIKRRSSSSLRQSNVLFSNIWLKQALQFLAANELQRSINTYHQTGSLISIMNYLPSKRYNVSKHWKQVCKLIPST